MHDGPRAEGSRPRHAAPLVSRIDLRLGLGLLTRLPVAVEAAEMADRGPRAVWAWPVIGAVLGGAAGLVAAFGLASGLPEGVAAVLALALLAAATGGLHEDGLADVADGCLGGQDRAARLRIMADSRVGAFGALALTLVTLARWSAVATLVAAAPLAAIGALMAAGALSRGSMAVVMATLPPARPEGLGAGMGRPGRATLLLALAGALLAAFVGAGAAAGLVATLAAFGAAAIMGWIARRAIGGQTGDVLGAVQQLSEASALAALAARLA